MAHTIKISDGTTTIDFLGTNYKILAGGPGLALRIPSRRRSRLGGQSYFGEVVEEWGIQVAGTSESVCWSKFQALTELLDQAQAFGLGENRTAVYFEYEPDNSGLANSVKSVILGPPGDTYWQMPANMTFIYRNGRYILGTVNDPIVLSFVRRGALLGATETKASSASTGNPAILTTAAFSDTAAIPWPYTVEIDCDATANGLDASDVRLLFQNAANKLYLLEAESAPSLSGALSTVVPNTSAGSVARVAVSPAQGTISDTSPGFASGVSNIALFAVMRNLSTAVIDWTVWATVFTAGASMTGPKTTIVKNDTVRKVVDLGSFYLPGDVSKINLNCLGDAVGVDGTDNLDVDYICGIALDESGHIMQLTTIDESADSEIHIDHQLLTKLDPKVWTSNSGGATVTDYPSRKGGAVLEATGNVVACLIFGVDTSGTYWMLRDLDVSPGNEMNFTLNVTRTKAYLNPL